jgi:hypothetical protein
MTFAPPVLGVLAEPDKDPWGDLRPFVGAFNTCRSKCVTPGRVLTVEINSNILSILSSTFAAQNLDISGNLSITGTITNTTYNALQTTGSTASSNVTALQTKTQYITASGGVSIIPVNLMLGVVIMQLMDDLLPI